MSDTNPWKDKVVFITGVCGMIGRELLRQILRMEPREVRGIDHNESELFFLREEYRGSSDNIQLSLGDVRDPQVRRMEGADVVLHVAAYKHVDLCERSPSDAIATNIIGTQNIIESAGKLGVERVLFTSSDKAVNPTSVMGTSKLMGERLMSAASLEYRHCQSIFASTRFGNILGSRGSVIPLFERQIAAGGPVTLTDPAMTRFIMSLEQAVHLVMRSTFLAQGGEVFVTKMPVIRIVDLAEVMIRHLAPSYGYRPADIPVQIVGTKPGEKLYEELVNEEEIRRTFELDDYFVIQPALAQANSSQAPSIMRAYNSSVQPALSQDELTQFLLDNNLLGRS